MHWSMISTKIWFRHDNNDLAVCHFFHKSIDFLVFKAILRWPRLSICYGVYKSTALNMRISKGQIYEMFIDSKSAG